MKVIAVVLFVAVLAAVQLAMAGRLEQQGGITCGQGGDPKAACCSGVKSLSGMAQSTDERRTACNCLKAAANRYSNLKDDAAQALPGKVA
ncbi:hypothetical protein HAX54_003260 [Datura stramonium]|uniref:Bifunctional inhibitor/plant lipid transfer protein/seed storage helical domain-containing protein n=1 Tax=Datura stramonium TaxID=4076 RepID=A0ABS8WU50_DATST|nr:hypothetical protein [Datura stramonium]